MAIFSSINKVRSKSGAWNVDARASWLGMNSRSELEKHHLWWDFRYITQLYKWIVFPLLVYYFMYFDDSLPESQHLHESIGRWWFGKLRAEDSWPFSFLAISANVICQIWTNGCGTHFAWTLLLRLWGVSRFLRTLRFTSTPNLQVAQESSWNDGTIVPVDDWEIDIRTEHESKIIIIIIIIIITILVVILIVIVIVVVKIAKNI